MVMDTLSMFNKFSNNVFTTIIWCEKLVSKCYLCAMRLSETSNVIEGYVTSTSQSFLYAY